MRARRRRAETGRCIHASRFRAIAKPHPSVLSSLWGATTIHDFVAMSSVMSMPRVIHARRYIERTGSNI
jgi:hypothetical protein